MKAHKHISHFDKLNLIRVLKDIFDNESEYHIQREYQEDGNTVREWTRQYDVSQKEAYFVKLVLKDYLSSNTSDKDRIDVLIRTYCLDKDIDSTHKLMDYSKFVLNVNAVKENLGMESVDILSALLGKNLI